MTMSRLETVPDNRWKRLFDLLGMSQAARTSAQEISRSTFFISFVVLVFGVVGVVAIVSWAYGLSGTAAKIPGVGSFPIGLNGWTIFASDLLVAGASAAIGGLVGFVFGIPRTLDPASRVAVAAAASQGDPAASSQAALSGNTNLERISDWFTTLLIGATLVQIKDVVHWIGSIGANLNDWNMSNENVVPVIVIYFSALAFIGVYLVTRLYLTFALQQTLFLLTGNYNDYPLQKLKADLADALATGDLGDLARVNAEFRSWRFQGSELDDPGLNYNLARMFAQMLAGDAAGDNKDEIIAKLKDAVERASKSPKVKKQLSDDLENGRLKTGIAEVDADLKTKTAPSP